MLQISELYRLLLSLTSIMVALVVIPAVCVGQTTNKELENALIEISLLKRIVAQQDQRISELEKAVKLLQNKADRAHIQSETRESPASLSLSAPWMTDANWSRMKDGMSQSQVTAILGKPTSIEDNGPFRTLFYRGEVLGSGTVSGNIKLREDRVWLVNKPVF